MPSLCNLPDETLLEVVHSFETIRSYENQSTAFKYKGQEKGRQLENHIRQRALYALCLTSRRLRCISLPALYASCITCASWSGLRKLQLFHRTISSQQMALGQTRRLADFVYYLENRLADHLGNSVQKDEFYHENSAARYFRLLADVVLCAPKLQHLCIVSLECAGVSFWDNLLRQWQNHTSLEPLGHGLTKLKYLCMQLHTQNPSSTEGTAVFERVSPALQSLTMLSELRISGATSNAETVQRLTLRHFGKLQVLEFTECSLKLCEVSRLVLACRNLRHVTCEWAFLDQSVSVPSILHRALLAHERTLETLTLDMREIRYSPSAEAESKLLGSLRSFAKLSSLEICETGFLSDASLLDVPDQVLPIEVSDLLPGNLERMTLLLQGEFEGYSDDPLDEALCLWRLVRDCRTKVPNLRSLYTRGRHSIIAPDLTIAFKKVGVQFDAQLGD